MLEFLAETLQFMAEPWFVVPAADILPGEGTAAYPVTESAEAFSQRGAG